MQQSMFLDRKYLPNNSHGLLRSTNTRVQPTTKDESNLKTDWDIQIKKIKRPVKKKINVILPLPVMIWITGLVLAGSEGVLMPYLDIAGAVVFFGASVWLGRILPCLEPDAEACTVRETLKKKVLHSVPSQVGLSPCVHDHGCAQGAHHLGGFGDKDLFCKGI
ncbi:hypothetical protein [Desulfobacter hydrogenophilus]|uniref:Uncharacterized protein n=1 Tax=Desulfobacter hydrogenophilus TaxID=2291 RepID=A0ABX5RGZ5_9BACT|nr:hypothetical protein [Desulfobacter hydrogenophilus]NDY71180.1 hypothetical protein [Desulfobacter hydrogenophilus]QBH14220.1 hypothetical protein EYB58_15645 [Desulfobacter hydrogenophilus]